MPKKGASRSRPNAKAGKECCDPGCCAEGGCCGRPGAEGCQVEAVASLDARGQMVLPKEVRDLLGVRANSKLAVVSMRSGGRVCCVALMKVEDIAGSVRRALGPLFNEIVQA